jgi:nitrile hydratase
LDADRNRKSLFRRAPKAEFLVTIRRRFTDSTAELRYLVLPQRPSGSDGWSEEKLATLVTRDAMIGVARIATSSQGDRA